MLVGNSGRVYFGENLCYTPQDQCPREPGEGYEKCRTVCRQPMHAEMQALLQAGDDAMGGSITVDHMYCCIDCTRALNAAGVAQIVLVGE